MSTPVLERPATYEEERGKPMPSKNHGAVQMNLGAEFLRDRRYRILGEPSLELAGRPLTPDLAVYPREPLDLRHDVLRMTEPPLVVVEIFSPTQSYREVLEKVEHYLQSGVKTCWVVMPPARTVTVYSSDGAEKTYVQGTVTDPATGITAEIEAVFS